MQPKFDTLKAELQAVTDGALAGLAYFNGERWAILYLDEELQDQMTGKDLANLGDDLVLENMSRRHHEQLFDKFAPLDATIRVFRQGIVILVPFHGNDFLAAALSERQLLLAERVLESCRRMRARCSVCPDCQ